MLIQCIKIFLGRDMSGTTFLGSKLVSFNQTLVPYNISKVRFRSAEQKSQKRFDKNLKIVKLPTCRYIFIPIKSSLRSHINGSYELEKKVETVMVNYSFDINETKYQRIRRKTSCKIRIPM